MTKNGSYCDKHISSRKCIFLQCETIETPTRTSPPRYELPKVPEGYTMSEEAIRDILACKYRDDLENYYASIKKGL